MIAISLEIETAISLLKPIEKLKCVRITVSSPAGAGASNHIKIIAGLYSFGSSLAHDMLQDMKNPYSPNPATISSAYEHDSLVHREDTHRAIRDAMGVYAARLAST
jgi:hypothetical protein